ncbi:MAG: sensory box histidine kinase [Myxococcaceae bacterium]|nr:sensory box histidine kinase [Myxococcaceae bacterium]MEA2752165.1 two-component system, NtrC family, sensor histidine kinase HydH [Myxococcales bacterium]
MKTKHGLPLHSSEHLKTTEERLARLSVLQELTVTALDLFDPDSAADPFLERVAERLGCLAAAWVAIEPDRRVTLVGAAGLSEASRALPIAPPPEGDTEPTALLLAYPELARRDLLRWSFDLQEADASPKHGRHALLLWFDPERKPRDEYLPAVERLVGVLVTVLMHRRLAQDLRNSYAELARTQLALIERERLAAIGELAATVAHEVRNPLAVIFNCIGSLQKTDAPPADAKALLGILAEEANRLNQIVSELLDFARPGEVLLLNESLEEIVTAAIAAVTGAQTTPVSIDLEISGPLRPQMLDARLVRRAVINLVTNAVQAIQPGGHVAVRVVDELASPRPGVRIEVTDDGPGIPAEIMARIFEPFFTTKASGTGLGLAIVKHVAEAHHGELTVRAEQSGGTTFVMRLPTSASSASPASSPR